MPDFIHRRVGAPFALVKNEDLPFTLPVSAEGVMTEVARLGPVASAPSGDDGIVVAAPADANQILRWHFVTGQTGGSSAATWVVDHGPDGKHGQGTRSDGVPSSSAVWTYNTGDGTPVGSYGMRSAGGDATAQRTMAQDLPKLAGQTKARIILGFRPDNIGDRAWGGLLEIPGVLWLRRLPGAELSVILMGQTYNFPNVFADATPVVLEIQINGNVVDVYRDFARIGTFAFNGVFNATTAPNLFIGNQPFGGRPAQGWFNYLGVFVGDLTDSEVAWTRQQAKAQIEGRPGGLMVVPAVPAPVAPDALRFTVAPSTTPAEFSTVGGVVNLRPGRARDGIGGPIDVRTRVLFGQIPGEGAEIDVPGWDYLPTAPGYLTFEQTADNAIHEPVTARSILPIAQTYPVLAASEISTRLQAFCTFIDNFDAGFPSDMVWRPSNVVDPGDGTVGLRLLRNTGVGRKHTGASVQFGFKSAANPAVRANSARLFNIEWTWQLIDTRAPGLAKGYMQTAFTFTVPWDAPRREIDFEYNTRSGYMECTIHMAANGDGPGSVADGISIEPPPEAFTSMRRWSIVGNADRIEWLYEDQVCARYIRGIGFDSSVQAFTPRRGIGNSQYARLMPGDTFLHRRDQHWQVNAQNIFIQQWMTDTNPAWLGPNTVPLDHPPLRFSRIDATEFGPPNTALQAGDWTLAPGSAGRAIVTVGAYRPARFRPTHLEYSVNGGAWVRLPGQFGPQTITGLVSGPRQIRLRPVAETIATDPTVTASTFVMNADPSDAKIVTIL